MGDGGELLGRLEDAGGFAELVDAGGLHVLVAAHAGADGARLRDEGVLGEHVAREVAAVAFAPVADLLDEALDEEFGEAVVEVLIPLQKRVKELEKDKAYIDSIIKNNAERASYTASKTLRKVQKKVGFPERIR